MALFYQQILSYLFLPYKENKNMLMKNTLSLNQHKIDFLKTFFEKNPEISPKSFEDVYSNPESCANAIDLLYRLVKMETACLLDAARIVQYPVFGHTGKVPKSEKENMDIKNMAEMLIRNSVKV